MRAIRKSKSRKYSHLQCVNSNPVAHSVWEQGFFYLSLMELMNLRQLPALERLSKTAYNSLPSKEQIQARLRHDMLKCYFLVERRYRGSVMNYQSMAIYLMHLDVREMIAMFVYSHLSLQRKDRLFQYAELISIVLRYLSFYSVDTLLGYRVKGRGLLADVFTRLVDYIFFNFNQTQVCSMAGLLHKVFSLVPVYAINSGTTVLPIKKLIWLVTSQLRRAKFPLVMRYARSCLQYHNCRWNNNTIRLSADELIVFYDSIVSNRCWRYRHHTRAVIEKLLIALTDFQRWALLQWSIKCGAVYLLPLWFSSVSNDTMNKAVKVVRESLFELFSRPGEVEKYYAAKNTNALVSLLAQYQFDWTCTDNTGSTLLYLSAMRHCKPFVEALLVADVSCLDRYNNYGLSPRMWLTCSQISFSIQTRKHRKFVRQLILDYDTKQQLNAAEALLTLAV